MSDYEQEEYQEEQEQQEQENVETQIELDYFQTEELLRKNQINLAIKDLEGLYTQSVQHNLKNWKVKILSQLLTIYCKQKDESNIKNTLSRIASLNQTEKYTENSIKSIVSIVKMLDGKLYLMAKELLMNFMTDLDPIVRLKSYLMFLEKAVEERNKVEAEDLFTTVEREINEFEKIPASSLLELYSLEVKHSRNTGADISDKIRGIQINMPILESQAYMSEGHISILKEAIAESMFSGGNYENSALFIAESLQEKARYGNNTNLKEILKTNVLMCLLINNPELRKNEKYNMLFNEISTPFKNEKDVQALFNLIDYFESNELEGFRSQFDLIDFKPESKVYSKLFQKTEYNLKKSKLKLILNSYKRIKFSYIAKRLNIDENQTEKMIFQFLTNQEIHGRIHLENPKEKFFQILPKRNEFLQIQLQNLRQLSKRYI